MSRKKGTGKVSLKQGGYRLYAQWLLIGAAIGAYYGVFFNTSPEAENIMFVSVLLLSLIPAIGITIFQNWKKGYPAKQKWMTFGKNFLLCFLFVAMLWLRPFVYQFGGKWAVIAFTTIFGMIVGVIMGLRKKTA